MKCEIVRVGVWKEHFDAELPIYATAGSCAADLKAQWVKSADYVFGYDVNNVKSNLKVQRDNRDHGYIVVPSRTRALIPTGLIFDIPDGFSIRLHSRSGHGWKNGVQLANSEGLIDYDYVQQTYVVLLNTADESLIVDRGDRIAQCEIVRTIKMDFFELKSYPERKLDRDGGLGSTNN